MKRSKLWYDDGQVFRMNSLARWDRRRRRREWGTRLTFAVMALAIGIMFAMSL